MNIHAFIFNWRRQYEKTKEKENQFKIQLPNIKLTIINSDDEHNEPGWVNIGEQSYMTDQILKAIELFDGDAMWIILADASYDHWDNILNSAKDSHSKYNWGVFAPNVDYTFFDSKMADINSFKFEEKNLKFVSCTDCICWIIHKDIINEFKNLRINMEPYNIGWGWDLMLHSLSILKKRPVIRDYSHTINHPKSTNYDTTKAEQQMLDLFNILPSDVKFIFYTLRSNRELIANLWVQ
jgi:hypothetical protein